ncbi:MAG: rod shape-determining protein MreD [Bacillota bacterium]|nr:rod shape-determining protein MreD [Bacillota bacterium]
MRSKIFVLISSVLLIILLQTTLLEYIKFNSIKPNLLLVFIVSVALLRGNIEGAVTGFFAGLMQDIVSGKVIGFYALLGMYLGIAIGSVNKRLYRDNFFVALVFSFVASIVYESVVYFFGVFLKGQTDFIYSFTNIILPEAVYNMAATVIIFFIVMKIDDRIKKSNKSSRKY